MPIKFLNDVAVDSSVLYVDTVDDRVGIGTSNPFVKLHVVGSALIEGTSTELKVKGSGSYDTANIVMGNAADPDSFEIATRNDPGDNKTTLNFDAYQTTGTSTITFGDNYLDLGTAGSSRLRVNSAGDVGIGTTSIGQKLTVNGNVIANRYYGTGSTTYYVDPNDTTQAANFAGDITINRSIPKIKINSTNNYPLSEILATHNGSTSPPLGSISWASNPGFTGSKWLQYAQSSPYSESSIKLPTSSSYNFAIKTLGSDRIVIDSAGDVGIGTTSPDAPLHVYGTLKVEDTSTSTSSFAIIEMEGRGVMGSQPAYLRTDYNGNFSIANSSALGSTTFRNTTLGSLISSNNSSNGNDSIFEATNLNGPSTDAVTMLFKANTNSQSGQYNEVGIEVDRMDGWTFSGSTKRGKMRLQTGGNDHITMLTSVSEFSTSSNTIFDQPCTFNGLSTGIGFFSGTTATFAGKVGVGRIPPVSKLDVNGGIRMADDTSTASISNVGTLRYRTSGNNSYVDMCMQTNTSTYAWVNIVTNSW